MTAYLVRLRYERGAEGVEELFEGLVRAPAYAALTVCHIEADERWFKVFADEGLTELYGIVAGELATDSTDEADKTGKSLAMNVTNDTNQAGADEVTGAGAVDGSVSDEAMDRLLTEETEPVDETYAVKVQLANGSIVDTEIADRFEQAGGGEGGGDGRTLSIEVPGVGLFSVRWELRRQLEPLGVRVLCFGARRDTWASGMQRDMGSGSFAYLLSYPRKDLKPMQHIFDYAPPETIGTVDEQRAYADASPSKK
jgi:hypothetical protein